MTKKVKYNLKELQKIREKAMEIIKKPYGEKFNLLERWYQRKIIQFYRLDIWRLNCALIIHIILSVISLGGFIFNNYIIICSGVSTMFLNLIWINLLSHKT